MKKATKAPPPPEESSQESSEESPEEVSTVVKPNGKQLSARFVSFIYNPSSYVYEQGKANLSDNSSSESESSSEDEEPNGKQLPVRLVPSCVTRCFIYI